MADPFVLRDIAFARLAAECDMEHEPLGVLPFVPVISRVLFAALPAGGRFIEVTLPSDARER